MSAPRWAVRLLRRLAPPGRAEDVLGDLEEAHRKRVERHGPAIANLLTSLEALDMAFTLMRSRPRRESKAHHRGIGVSWLDFKLGFRMLRRYPGLTAVGGLAIAFGVSVGAGTFEFVDQVLSPTLPLDGGDRIIGIWLRDRRTPGFEAQTLYDFMTWRDELSSVTDLGAFRTVRRNLITGEAGAEPIYVAEISASAFRVARVPPLMGRALDASDEQPGAPPVVVLGYDLWQTRLGGDPTVVGHTVRLGSDEATVVGVMPDGFAFPLAHRVWVPLRLRGSGYAPREAPGVRVFGRLAPGATLEQAQVELTALSLRVAADLPDTHRHLAAEATPFARSIEDLSAYDKILRLTNVLVVLVLILACGNVGLLMFARAASRESEIVVRSALGASRGRIITQLLAEALVLAGVGAIVGIAAIRLLLKSWLTVLELELLGGASLPFWFRDTLAPSTVLYAVGLTVLGAAIAGVIPGLKATRGLQARLRQATHGGGGLKLGGVWTVLIVVQIAVTVAVPVIAFFIRGDAFGRESTDVQIAAHEYLAAQIQIDRDAEEDPATFLARFDTAVRELEERLGIDPAVLGVTRADRLPGMYHSARLIEVDEGAAPLGAPPGNCIHDCAGYRVSSATVDRNFFEVLDAPVRAGRGFEPGDFQGGAGTVIVNRSFVERVMGGRNPVGRRLRYIDLAARTEPGGDAEPGPWHEIVGVVPDLAPPGPDPKVSRIYHPMPPSGVYPANIAVRVRGDALAFAPRLRMIGADVGPTLRLEDVLPLDEVDDAGRRFWQFWFWFIVAFSAVAMVLSMAGIYSIMAFTVSMRTREIGIRVALGSSRAAIAFAIFRRPLIHVALGVTLGAGLTSMSSGAISLDGDPHKPQVLLMVIMYGLLMMGVCLLACIVPTRRALRVPPSEALRTDV